MRSTTLSSSELIATGTTPVLSPEVYLALRGPRCSLCGLTIDPTYPKVVLALFLRNINGYACRNVRSCEARRGIAGAPRSAPVLSV